MITSQSELHQHLEKAEKSVSSAHENAASLLTGPGLVRRECGGQGMTPPPGGWPSECKSSHQARLPWTYPIIPSPSHPVRWGQPAPRHTAGSHLSTRLGQSTGFCEVFSAEPGATQSPTQGPF